MAVKTFDNLGNGSGTWEDGTDWDPVNVPADNDTIIIDADCSVSTDYSAITFENLHINAGDTLTIANGGDVRFDVGTCDFTGNFTVETGGNIRFTDITELETNGLVTLDGGTIELVETDASLITWEIKGTGVVGTANGGTIKLIAATLNLSRIQFYIGVGITGNSNSRIVINGDSGASTGYACFSISSFASYVDFDGVTKVTPATSAGRTRFDHCLFHNIGTVFHCDESHLFIRDSFIYDNVIGLDTLDLSRLEFSNVVFGETEGAVGAENTTHDIDIDNIIGVFHNCKLSSTLPIAAITGLANVSFTSYDQDETDWLQYQGLGHYAQPEFGAGAQGGAGTAVKCVTSASAADDDFNRFRRLVGFIPATHADVLAVTLYIKGTNTKTAKLRIDPDSIYGTTQVYNETADGNWNQRTIPNYTVNVSGGAGTKVCIPIYLDMYGASETWYYDTLDWTVS